MNEVENAYDFIKVLGHQSKRKFAEVHLMREKNSGKTLVFKVVQKNEHTLLQQERLRREASFSFQEKGLPETIDFKENDLRLLLIKEHIPGKPLQEYWNVLPSRQRALFLLNFVQAFMPIFQSLRAQKIVHCDIKPSNIIVDQIGNEISVGLIDFGMALYTEEIEERKTLFPLGYAAPELVLNRLDLVDHRTDLFALGVVIWRLFVGVLPLTHPNPSIMTNLQITHPLPENSELPKGLINLLQKMSFKHVFRTSPNRMESTELTKALIEGLNGRYHSLDEFYNELLLVLKPKIFFGLI